MHSISQLNDYSDETISHQDERPANIRFATANSTPINFTINEGETHIAQPGNEIVEIINGNQANICYVANLSLANATATWTAISPTLTVNYANGVYLVSNIARLSDWESLKNPVITMPIDYSNDWFYTTSITFNGNIRTTWVTSVNVIDLPELSDPTYDYYTSNATSNASVTLSGSSRIVDIDSGSSAYKIVCTVSNTNVLGTFTSNGTGGTSNWFSANSNLVITGTKTQVNSHLGNLIYTPPLGIDQDFFIRYTLTNPVSNLVTVKTQSIYSTNDGFLSRGSPYYYLSAVENQLNNSPRILDITTNGSANYRMTITSLTSNVVSNIRSSISGSNAASVTYYTGNATAVLYGTRSQINNSLDNLYFTPNSGVNSDFQFKFEAERQDPLVLLYNFGDEYYANVQLLLQANIINGNTFVDGSYNQWVPTSRVGVTKVTSNVGIVSNQAIQFTSVNNGGLTYPNNLALQPNNDFTWEAYVRPQWDADYWSTWPAVIGYGGSYGALMIYANGDTRKWQFEMDKDGSAAPFPSTAPTDIYQPTTANVVLNTWQHLAIARSGTSVRFYVNGNLISTSTLTGTITQSDRVTLGSRGENQSVQTFSGLMDQVRFTKDVARYTGNTFVVPGHLPSVTLTNVYAPQVTSIRFQEIDNANFGTGMANISLTRYAIQNTPDMLFTQPYPEIVDNAAAIIYSVTFTSSYGDVGNDTNFDPVFTVSGSRAQVNSILPTLKFYPNRDVYGIYPVTVSLRRDGVYIMQQQFNVDISVNTNPLPLIGANTYIFTSTTDFTPTVTQAKYLKYDILVVGQGGGGGAHGGGGGGQVYSQQLLGNLRAASYRIVPGTTGGQPGARNGTGTTTFTAGSKGASSNIGLIGQTPIISVEGGFGGAGGVSTSNSSYAGGNCGVILGGTGDQTSSGASDPWPGTGGGGAGAGGPGGNTKVISGVRYGGNGGPGIYSTISGANVAYGGGGAGDGGTPTGPPVINPNGLPGVGGGGNCLANGTDGLGGGGGAGGHTATPGRGGYGVVIIKFYE